MGTKINELVKESALEKLLVMAAQIHGHYCPGLALGVIAGTGGIQKMGVDSDGLEDLLAIVETNNCFSDGIQFVTGCSFGNNALIFKDTGKIACMLVNRKGQGFRMVLKPDARDQMHVVYPGFADTFNKVVAKGERDSSTIDTFKSEGRTKAFTVLRLDFEKLFTVEPVRNIKVPDYAPSHESFTCTACGESTMETRGRVKDDGKYCLECAGEKVNRLTGSGINIE